MTFTIKQLEALKEGTTQTLHPDGKSPASPSIEQWAPVVGYEGIYEVSTQGRVASVSTNWRGYGQRIMEQDVDRYGYMKVRLTREGKRKKFSVHRLVCIAFLGAPGDEEQVCHINGDATDNRLENLKWGTAKENAEDRNRHGMTAIGDRNAQSVLKVGDIPRIRRLAANGLSQCSIAKEFQVSDRTIRDILTGRTWKHVA